MQTKVFAYVRLVLLCVLAATLGAGCATKDDPVAQAEKKDMAKHNGHLTKAEQTRLNERQNHISHSIYRDKHN